MYWPPVTLCKQRARIEKGWYKCAECLKAVPGKIDGKTNHHADHIEPVVDPHVGFIDWDTVISRMFVEADGLQLLCGSCHKQKTADENAIRRAREAKEKLK